MFVFAKTEGNDAPSCTHERLPLSSAFDRAPGAAPCTLEAVRHFHHLDRSFRRYQFLSGDIHQGLGIESQGQPDTIARSLSPYINSSEQTLQDH